MTCPHHSVTGACMKSNIFFLPFRLGEKHSGCGHGELNEKSCGCCGWEPDVPKAIDAYV